jgi:ABC-type branched-subunit amino acid transport system ATPase component
MKAALDLTNGDVPSVKVPEVALEDICKRFGDNVAPDGISVVLRPGEITALLGENGAGKSALMVLSECRAAGEFSRADAHTHEMLNLMTGGKHAA